MLSDRKDLIIPILLRVGRAGIYHCRGSLRCEVLWSCTGAGRWCRLVFCWMADPGKRKPYKRPSTNEEQDKHNSPNGEDGALVVLPSQWWWWWLCGRIRLVGVLIGGRTIS